MWKIDKKGLVFSLILLGVVAGAMYYFFGSVPFLPNRTETITGDILQRGTNEKYSFIELRDIVNKKLYNVMYACSYQQSSGSNKKEIETAKTVEVYGLIDGYIRDTDEYTMTICDLSAHYIKVIE
jgi:hypothetical protein